MRARGELPNGVHFESPVYYRDMTGDGELWMREDGLPLRQVLNIRFPEQNDERVQAQIKVDFSHFGQTRFVGGEFVQIDPASAGGSAAGVWNTLQRQAPVFGTFLSLLLVTGIGRSGGSLSPRAHPAGRVLAGRDRQHVGRPAPQHPAS